jgi:hypothetical protein
MAGQAIFIDALNSINRLGTQLASRSAAFILHEAYISFQDNHFDSAPIYRPPLAAGLDVAYEKTSKTLLDKIGNIIKENYQQNYDRENTSYVDIKVTSNGREAVIESDWDLMTIAYDDIRGAST